MAQVIMNSDEWSKRAYAFGQIALDASISAQKTVEKTVHPQAQEISQKLASIGHSIASKLLGSGGTRWDRRRGTWESDKSIDEVLKDVEAALTDSVKTVQLSVVTDSTSMTILAQSSWRENLPKFPNSFHEAKLQIQLDESLTGTIVEYTWMVDDFPKGLIASRLVSETNQVLESVLQPWPKVKWG